MPITGIFFFMNKDEANLAKIKQKCEIMSMFRMKFAGFKVKKSMKTAKINDFKKCKKSCKKGLHFLKKVI